MGGSRPRFWGLTKSCVGPGSKRYRIAHITFMRKWTLHGSTNVLEYTQATAMNSTIGKHSVENGTCAKNYSLFQNSNPTFLKSTETPIYFQYEYILSKSDIFMWYWSSPGNMKKQWLPYRTFRVHYIVLLISWYCIIVHNVTCHVTRFRKLTVACGGDDCKSGIKWFEPFPHQKFRAGRHFHFQSRHLLFTYHQGSCQRRRQFHEISRFRVVSLNLKCNIQLQLFNGTNRYLTNQDLELMGRTDA